MLRRILALISAFILLGLGIAVILILVNTPTGKEKAALAKIRAEENELARDFDVVVLRSGFQKRKSGERDIYVPALLVRVANFSGTASKAVSLSAEFLRQGRIFCGAWGAVPELKPEESSEIWLKCIELTGFGSVAWGLTLAETTEAMDYQVHLESKRASLLVIKGSLGSMLL